MAVMYNYPMKKNNERLLNTSNTKNIILQNEPKVILSDKIDSINNKINMIPINENIDKITIDNNLAITDRKYKKFTIVKDNNKNTYISKKDNVDRYSFNDIEKWVRLNPYGENRCIVKNTYNNGNHQYATNGKYSLNDISQMLDRGDYYGYIKDGDWFELETELWKFRLVVNINIYRNADINTSNKPNNIDLICVECLSRTGNNESLSLPWGTTKPIIPQVFNNPKIQNTYTPIILSNFTNELWDTFISPLLLITSNKGFGNVFISHIINKYKNTVARNFNKNDIKDSSNMTDSGIYEQANLGKAWFLYESEILDQPILSSTIEGMMCQQYPMFKYGKYRQFRFNNQECCIITSSIRNGTFDPIYIRQGYSVQTQPEYIYFPMFGMRFI